jgi:tetratricopeptide (TPR) repeat protein/predicted aspartyl protease
MRIGHFACMSALAALSLAMAPASANCQLQQVGTMPVDMQGLRPVVSTKINGMEARFMLDTGSFFSTIWRDAATQYRLPIAPVPGGSFSIAGLGGRENAHLATAQSFDFFGLHLRNTKFLVIDQTVDSDTLGLIGQDLLRAFDVEFDLANGTVRFFKPVGCEHQPLAYWAVSTPYSSVDLGHTDPSEPHLRTTATINGHRVSVWFDTGSPRSMLSLVAAARAGITPNSPGVTFLGLSGGIGPASNQLWSAPVDDFQIGGEKVQHTHLLIRNLEPQHAAGDMSSWTPDLLLGADYFLSHRIYVAYSQDKLYFTYNGGPLFDLNVPQAASTAAAPPPGAATRQAGAGDQPYSDAPTDADGFRRRGMAYASMHDLDRALADLTRACDLAPRDTQAHYDRGVVYAESGQFKSALEDFDAVITGDPGNIDARLRRVELLQSHPEADPTATTAQLKSDLDAVSRSAPPAADVRRALAGFYGELGDYADAMEQIDQWLNQHRLPNDQEAGLNSRCWLRATSNRDLTQALDDCNRALSLRPHAPEELGTLIARPLAAENPEILDSRGLVYLRLDRLQDALRDYDAALSINANMPTSLYGRGLAELRLGEKAQGQADLSAAEKLNAGIARRFALMGLTP